MNFLQPILNEAPQATPREIATVKRIISGFVTPTASYEDIVMRLAAFTQGMATPRTDVDASIDVLPVIRALTDAGFIKPVGGGKYKRKDAVSQVMQQVAARATDKALDGDLSKSGRLSPTQTTQMQHLATSGEAGDKLDRAQRNYKQGGRYSGATKEYIIKVTKERDPAWQSLSDSTKDMISRLQTLSNPSYSFKVLKALLAVRAKKKGYTSFIEYVKQNFNDQGYVDALYDLQSIGAVDAESNTISNESIKLIRNAMDFFKEQPVEGIPPLDKVGAFLPNFIKIAVSSSANTFRAVNNIITNPRFTPTMNLINKKLTDDRLDYIMATDDAELKKNQTLFAIKFLAKSLKADTVDELKAAIEEKKANRQDFKSDANKEAKAIGRMEEFLDIFDI